MVRLLFLNVGGSEIIIIALVVLLLFGSKSIPEFMRGIGKMTREFKDAVNGIEREVRQSVDFDAPSKAQPPKQIENKKSATADPTFGGDEPKTDEQPINP
jgi:sec-independent protein translocase protein TatA